MGWGMENMDQVADSVLMPAMVGWGGADLMLVFVMWAITMTAMLLLPATPILMLFARVAAARKVRAPAWGSAPSRWGTSLLGRDSVRAPRWPSGACWKRAWSRR